MQAFGNIAGRDDAAQNARYGVSMIDRELRVAGVGVVDPKPLIVQAAPYAITFNVDLITRDQVKNYAARKHMTIAEAERWLAPNLSYDAT